MLCLPNLLEVYTQIATRHTERQSHTILGISPWNKYQISWRDRPQTLFCNMYEWQTGTKISSMDKGSKLTYLGESTTYDTERMGLVSESRETKNVLKMIFDEDSNIRRNYCDLLPCTRRRRFLTTALYCGSLVFNGSNVQYRMDAVHKLSSECRERK